MSKGKPIFYSALLLTLVNLLLRLAGTSFQVYLSSRIGAEGIGLLQLVMSVGSMAMVAGMAGVRTASMYLTAEELGKKRPGNLRWVLSGCLQYSVVFSAAVSLSLWFFAPFIAEKWIGNTKTIEAIRLFALFLPVNCLTGVMVGHFTGANRIGTLAAVEVAEQCVSMAGTLAMLHFWAGTNAEKCCLAVVLGGGLGGCVTLLLLTLLRLQQKPERSPRIRVARRLADVALPLALADDVKTGINTVENLMVPQRLALYSGIGSSLAAFGRVSGMVFPVMMFPACILYGLAELLIPELARCHAAGSSGRIRYLVRRSVKIAVIYGCLFCGLLVLAAQPLCRSLYGDAEAGQQLKLYALLVPMLYCDAIVDAMTKGLGQQKICVRYNILTSVLDVIFLYILLPEYGMTGYFISFAATHVLNFLLSLCRLLKISGVHIRPHRAMATAAATLGSILLVCRLTPVAGAAVYPVVLGCILYLMGILRKTDLLWFKDLLRRR